MAKKPTYEELEQRVKELENAAFARKQAEDALKEREEKYRLAMDATTDGLWAWEVLSGEVYYSPSWTKMVGELDVAPEYSSWENRIHPKDKEIVLLTLQDHLKGRTDYWQKEHRLRSKTGEWKWVLGRGRVLERDANGQPLRMFGSMTDISERKQAQEALQKAHDKLELRVEERTAEFVKANEVLHFEIAERKRAEEELIKSEKLYKEAQSLAHIGHWDYEPHEDSLTWSDELYSIFEIDKDAGPVSFEVFIEHVHPEDRDTIRGQAEKGEDYRSEYRIVMDNGSVKHIREEVLIVRQEDGKILLMKGTAQDITKQKQNEETLRKSEKKYRDLYNLLRLMTDNVPDLIFAKDMEMRYIFTNKGTCKRLLNARDQDESIGKTHMYFADREKKAHPEDPYWHDFGEICVNSDSVVMKTKKAQRFDEFGNVKGKYVHFDIHKAPFLDDQGNMIGTVGCGRDVTKEKEIEKELKRSYDELERRVEERTAELLALQEQLIRSECLTASGQLAGTVAHEINSPLQAITILLSTMEEGWKDDAELMERVRIVEEAFRSIRDTVKNLLDLNRPVKDEKQQANVKMVLKQTLGLVKSNLARNGIKVNLDLSSEIPGILASPQQLNHLFLNLINNAMEAMTGVSSHRDEWKKRTAGWEINIRSMISEGNIVIRVADNGPGISEEDLHQIFDPFYTRKKEMGIGVGLSICHGFVEDHGGTIAAENSPEGGAVFTIKLPI